jgi:hypothetical protein
VLAKALSYKPPTARPGTLRVNAVHRDVPFTKPMTAAVDREIADLARWLKLDLEMPGPAGQRAPA